MLSFSTDSIAFAEASWQYLLSHPIVLATLLYLGLNCCKRIPPPKTQPWLLIWQVFEACMLLGWEKWGGPLKTWPALPVDTWPDGSKVPPGPRPPMNAIEISPGDTERAPPPPEEK